MRVFVARAGRKTLRSVPAEAEAKETVAGLDRLRCIEKNLHGDGSLSAVAFEPRSGTSRPGLFLFRLRPIALD